VLYFEVRNFKDYQHYSKRNPPWIRLYYRLLHDREFFRLKDETKFLVIGCYLIASQHENKIPADWMALLGRLDRLIWSDDAGAKYSINLPEIPADYRQTLKGDRSANATV